MTTPTTPTTPTTEKTLAEAESEMIVALINQQCSLIALRDENAKLQACIALLKAALAADDEAG